MRYRLLIDLEAVDFLATLKPAERVQLRKHICGRYAIKFWDDFADRHLKILQIVRADF